MATATERKFTSLRKRLDQLGYRQPLGIEALPLVDKLFGDLLHTTESLKAAKQQLGRHKEEKSVWEQHVEPYQADNARFIKENNELHQRVLKVKENSDQRIRELKAILRRFEHENADLKFLNTQYLQRLRTQEKESGRKTEKILELQEKNFQAVIQTPGGKKKSIPFRRQRMEIDCALPESTKTSGTEAIITLPSPDPYIADLLQVADQRMVQLQSLVDKGNHEKEKLQASQQSMRQLVENREVEIERLTQMLKGGRPAEALAAEGIRQSRERMVAHLNIQVDFLQKASHELERKLADSEEAKAQLQERVGELTAKNARICSELQEIGELVKETEQERGESDGQLKKRIQEAEAEKSGVLASLEELKKNLEWLESEKAQLLLDNQRMAKLLDNSEGDRKEVGDMLERLSEERKNFQRQCKQFEDKEAILQRKIADLAHQPRSPPSAGVEVRKLRKERDSLKNAVSSFETELLEIQMDTKILAEDRDNFKLLYEQVSNELARSRQQARAPTGSGAILRRLEGERDHVLLELQQKNTECLSLKDRLKSIQDTQQHDLNTLEDRLAELRVQLEETCAERDELSERLSSTKQVLTSMETELESSTQALSAANKELVKHRTRVTQLQALVEASERTRQEQQKGIRSRMSDIQTAQSTVASLNSKIAKLTHEVNMKEERIAELRHALTMLDQDHDQLVSEADQKDETIARLKTELEQKVQLLEGAEGKLVQLHVELGKVETIRRDKDVEVCEVQGELKVSRTQLLATRQQVESFTLQISELKGDLNTMTHENQSVHSELQRTLGEKDTLDLKLQDYSQTLSYYEETISLKEQEKSALVDSYSGLNNQTEILNATLKKMEESLSAAKLELLAASKEKQEVVGVMEQQACEIQALRTYEQQLSSMTHALSKMEGVLRQEQEEKRALVSDLESTREICVQLDRSKDSLTTQMSTQSIHYEQIQSQLGDMKTKRDLLEVQLRSERSATEQLQALISGERQKEFQAHVVGEKKEEELQHLHQLLAKLEADRLALSDQTRKLRADTAVQSEALQRLKTELASERFQKQHMKQQLDIQRCSLTLLTSPKLNASTRTPSPPRDTSTSPKPELPDEPALSSPQSTPSLQQDSREGEEMFARERQNLADKSAKLVDQLLSSSDPSSADSPPHLPHN